MVPEEELVGRHPTRLFNFTVNSFTELQLNFSCFTYMIVFVCVDMIQSLRGPNYNTFYNIYSCILMVCIYLFLSL